MRRMTLDVEARQVSTEPAHRGVPPRAPVHVLVEVPDDAGEAELYTDANVIERFR